jgi:hypothetical protein
VPSEFARQQELEIDRMIKQWSELAKVSENHARWRQDLADDLAEVEKVRDALAKKVNELDNVLRSFRALRMAVDAMMAPLGYHGTISARDDRVQAVMDALEQIDNEDQVIDTTNGGTECAECHAKNGTVCEDLDCPGRRARAA